MGKNTRRALSVALGALATGLMASTVLAAEVTYERLLKPEDGNWLTNHRTYDGNRYSPLDQINTKNVGGLHVAFAVPLVPHLLAGLGGGMQGTPLVDDGIMYMSDGAAVTYRIDVSNGKQGFINWIMDPQTDLSGGGLVNNKGVALLGDNVYDVTSNGDLIAINASTGQQVFDVKTQQNPNEAFTMAPLAVKDKIIMGPAGDSPMRGRLEARSAKDGSPVWTFWSIPGPGEPGHETWPADNDSWKTAGSSFWVTGIYNPDSNTVYYGVSNPYPYDPTNRAGDNLYSNSTVALDADTGKLNWYFQYTPNDRFDYDEEANPQLFKMGNELRLVHFGRNGFFYSLTAKGLFLNATQYVDQLNWTKGIDPKTGKPVEYKEGVGLQKYAVEGGFYGKNQPNFCPNPQGGVNQWPTSFSHRTNLAYGAAIEGCSIANDPMSKTSGSVVAVDGDGKIAKKAPTPFAPYGGILTTGGGLVFSSTVNGDFFAMDDTSLQTLWNINLGSSIDAPPMTYTAGGKQYIALPVSTSGINPLYMHYTQRGDDPNNASVKNIQRTWTLYFFSL